MSDLCQFHNHMGKLLSSYVQSIDYLCTAVIREEITLNNADDRAD